MADVFISANRGLQDYSPELNTDITKGLVIAGSSQSGELEVRIHTGVGWTRDELNYVLERIAEYITDPRQNSIPGI